ncbi:MAG: DMT family transporter [Actinomycetota bacterium]|nr:DMT family transporter [Actinomycetota bacterium]
MTIAVALLAAALFGIGDFLGGSASRKFPAAGVLIFSAPVGLIPSFVLTFWVHGELSASAVAWGGGAGFAGGFGVLLLFRGLASAPMSVVAPLTAVTSVVVPVVVGVATGERPPGGAYVGTVLALAAVALISRGEDHGAGDTGVPAASRSGVLLALLAGIGFGLYFVLLKHAPNDSGLWPIVAGRLTSTALFVGVAVATTGLAMPRGRVALLALLSGACDVSANVLYLIAVRGGLLSVVAVVIALYPAATVLLARVVFAERLARPQLLGLACAALGVGLIAAS